MTPSKHNVSRPVASQIGKRITELLAENGMTEWSLQEQEGISYNTTKSWQRGDSAPTLGVLLRLVDVFGLCSIEEILGGPLGTRLARAQTRHPEP